MKYTKRIPIEFDADVGKTLARHPIVAKHALGKYGVGIGEYKGERFIRRYMPKRYVKQLKSILPEKAQKFLLGMNLTEIRLLAPHIHLQEECVINFYLHTNGEVTSFWDGVIERDDEWTQDNGNGYMNVNTKKLTLAESFIAQPGECWLLNTRQPHSVSLLNDDRTGMFIYEPKDTDEARWVVQGYFNAPFEYIAECFEN